MAIGSLAPRTVRLGLRRGWSLGPISLTTLVTFLASVAAPGIAAAQAAAEHQAKYAGQSVALSAWASEPSSSFVTSVSESQAPLAPTPAASDEIAPTSQGRVDAAGSTLRTEALDADNVASAASATGVGLNGEPLSGEIPPDTKDPDPKDPVGDPKTGSDSGHSTPVGDKSGVSSSVISGPPGAGSIQGMGESFSAQLSTGIATFSVPFSLPTARGGSQPALALAYSSAAGFGRAGVGWSMAVPFIARQTDRGTPNYDDRGGWHPEQDRFIFNGGQELVPICVVGDALQGCDDKLLIDPESGTEALPVWAAGHQYFRARVEGSFLRFFWSPDKLTWRVQGKGGITLELGMPLDGSDDRSAIELNPNRENELYRWNLARQYDTYGEAHPVTGNPTPHNVIVYKYLQDGGSAFLSDIYDTPPVTIATTPVTDLLAYAHHTHLEWEARTDPTFSFRAGWRMEENLRLSSVDVTSKTFNEGGGAGVPRRLVRRYHLTYDGAYHPSLLQRVQVEGRCADAESTAPAENSSGVIAGDVGCQRLPPMSFDYSHVDAVRTDGGNRTSDLAGYEAFSEVVQKIEGSPPHSLDDEQIALFDINADSLPDVLVTLPGRYGDGHGVFFNGPGGRANAFGSANLITVSGVLGANANDIKLSNLNINPTDLDGDGIVNLLHMPRVKTYSTYTPQQTANGNWTWFGRVITTASGQDPKIDFTHDALETRIADVNFDGLVDVVVSTGTEFQTFFALGRYPGGAGQFGYASRTGTETASIANEPSRACVPHSGLAVRFSDSDIKLAEMNGDGIVDILRLRRGALQYWPGRGNGVWGTGDRTACPAGEFAFDSHISMDQSPFYSDIPEKNLRLEDVNGDGLTDLVEVRFDEVDVWLNVDGRGWTKRHIIAGTPASPAFANRVQLVDVNGSGTRDILWGNGERYEYIDLAGGVRPWVLTHVDNGLGKTTDLEYSTTAHEMLAAELAGQPWTKKMPSVAHIVKRVSESENITIAGRQPGNYVNEYSYRDPVFDGRQREFRGFSSAQVKRLGDDNSPTDITETQFLLGECVDDDPTDNDNTCLLEGWRENGQEALKGLPLVMEKFDERGVYLSTSLSTYRLRHLYTGLDGRFVRQAFASASRDYLYDTGGFVPGLAPENVVSIERDDVSRGAGSTAVVIQSSLAVPVRSTTRHAIIAASSEVDAFGNRVRAFSRGCESSPGCELDDEIIKTYTVAGRPGGDPTGWLWRTVESYVQGSVHTAIRQHTYTTYDSFGAPILTKATLAGSVALDRTLPTTLAPTIGTRSQDGLITTGTKFYDAFGNVTRSTAPNGRCSDVGYALDPVFQQLPTLDTIYTNGCPTGPSDPNAQAALSTSATYDRGFGSVSTVTNIQGQPTKANYDQLGRVKDIIRANPAVAGALSPLPSLKFEYFLPTDLGVGVRHSIIRTQTQDGVALTDNSYLESYAYVDGLGRHIAALSEADPNALDQGAWIVGGISEYDSKSAVRRKYQPLFYSGDPKAFSFAAVPDAPSGYQSYDAFGRPLQTFDLDGTVTLASIYHALSTDLYDAADLEAGAHQNSFVTTVSDGHGRQIRSTERFHINGQMEMRHVITQFLTSGEPEVIRRRRGSDVSSDVVRWLRYDSLGRLVLNVDPHASTGFNPDPNSNAATIKAWRYAYDDAGDLVGTSDARGCGVNFFYDAAGRIVGEDYAPCDETFGAQQPYSGVGVPALGEGLEVLYEYADSFPGRNGSLPALPPSYPFGNALRRDMAGLLVGIHDRASTIWTTYDGRGRATKQQSRVAKPSYSSAWNARYTTVNDWFTKAYTYDAADREISTTTGAVAPELLAGGQSTVSTEYSKRGTVKSVSSSYSPSGNATLISGIERTADGRIRKLVYGDAAATTTSYQYDDRRRVSSVQTYRGLPSQWLNTASSTPGPDPNGLPSSFQLLLQDEELTYDVVNNPTVVRDWRTPEEWPAGAKPVSKKIDYDDLYRVTRVAYQYAGGDDTWTSPHAADTDGTTANDDSRRGVPSPHVQFAKRIQQQSFQYDWLGNTTKTTDDAGGFYDRSLGTITNDTAAGKPYRLKSATSSGGTSNGSLDTTYDAAGNLLTLNVTRSGQCVGSGSACPQVSFQYQWDEVGRLGRAVRRDGGPAAPITTELRYAYDANDQRVIKMAVVGAAQRSTIYVFDSLELRRALWDGAAGKYERSAMTEVPYLSSHGARLARVVYDGNSAVPRVGGSSQHVFFELGDHLVSTSVVLDKATGELVERSTFQAYGGAESDYRPDRWKGFREDYRFTGKEEDVEVGVVYFGKRFLNPLLGRWMSADPLTIHALGADLNAYAYVSGRALKNIDPLGLTNQAPNPGDDGTSGTSGMGSDTPADDPQVAAGNNDPDVVSGADDGAGAGGVPNNYVEDTTPRYDDSHESVLGQVLGGVARGAQNGIGSTLEETTGFLSSDTPGVFQGPPMQMERTDPPASGPGQLGYIGGEVGVQVLVAKLTGSSRTSGPAPEALRSGPTPVASAGLELMDSGDKFLAQYQLNGQLAEGYYDVVAHGTPTQVQSAGGLLSANGLRRKLASAGDYQGQPIRLVSCSTGACAVGDAHGIAQALANKMRVNVLAPTDLLHIWSNGRYTIGPTPHANTGSWIEFAPTSR